MKTLKDTGSRRLKQNRSPAPYEAVEHVASEEHPVDAAVERRLPQKELLKQMRSLSDQMMAALGDERHLWLRLEEVLGDYHINREEFFFNIGYEHGVVAGRADALRALVPRPKSGSMTDDNRIFADRVRDLAVQAELPLPLAIASLLETAWVLVLSSESLCSPKNGSYRRPVKRIAPLNPAGRRTKGRR
ncbi:MAG: hypothetical protein HY897_09485 [Deltaproteobacteria bacterium]|nr:hypothetical protein [Deltaproteobacteria bacterium]